MTQIIQMMILTLNGSSILFLSFKSNRVKRWGFLALILSEPFWMITSYRHNQWAIFILCFWYLIISVMGYYNHRKGLDA